MTLLKLVLGLPSDPSFPHALTPRLGPQPHHKHCLLHPPPGGRGRRLEDHDRWGWAVVRAPQRPCSAERHFSSWARLPGGGRTISFFIPSKESGREGAQEEGFLGWEMGPWSGWRLMGTIPQGLPHLLLTRAPSRLYTLLGRGRPEPALLPFRLLILTTWA